ncbi:hypothetical protein DAPPUDRAFT_238117 [Daphnia pulex]|uniref:Uncharacterized protein n=1 Tax=Daphnia pulex TaxID=6669 RepID=E9G6N7_DAPPU|nr:hypothetical protein DAPPUDRAFT_238117 [Daphnia pulex]|eukprot:EFX84776.1 hypothetical protein DAPPUDRAFT_238117 [Daphnia pulex]
MNDETDEHDYSSRGLGLQLPHKLPAVPFWKFIAPDSSEVNRGVPSGGERESRTTEPLFRLPGHVSVSFAFPIRMPPTPHDKRRIVNSTKNGEG